MTYCLPRHQRSVLRRGAHRLSLGELPVSTRAKWFMAVSAGSAWASWLWVLWHPSSWPALEATLRMVTLVASVVLALGLMVAPVLRTAAVWREIGVREQQKKCDVCPVSRARAGRLADVIPFRSLTRTDN